MDQRGKMLLGASDIYNYVQTLFYLRGKMTQSNNVIIFPKVRKIVNPVTKEDIEELLEENKQYHIQQTIDFITPMLFSHLNIAGFIPNQSEMAIKEGAFIVESIRSHMFTHYGNCLFAF